MGLFKKKKKNKTDKELYLVCNMCIYDDEFCSMCSTCNAEYRKYPSNFVAHYAPKTDNLLIGGK